MFQHDSSFTTICALSSGKLPSGVAIIRISGPETQNILRNLSGSIPEPRIAKLKTLRSTDGFALDQALVLFFPSPASFTGEDCAELHLHGGKAVVEKALSTIISFKGCRLATAGEFSLRAFLNGKMDLTALEGVADLIDAETEEQRKLAFNQSSGELFKLYDAWQSRMTRIRVLIEANLDFSDEGDVEGSIANHVKTHTLALIDEMKSHINTYKTAEIIRDGYRIALIGAPNVGKSSLLNALSKRDIAIVSDIAGTTRDVVEAVLNVDGYKVIISDTAGIRETTDYVEKIGIERAQSTAENADMVLVLHDGSKDVNWQPATGPLVINVCSKADLMDKNAGMYSDLAVSVKTDNGLDDLFNVIRVEIAKIVSSGKNDIIAGRLRYLEGVLHSINALERCLDDTIGEEIIADHLRSSSDSLGRITGMVDPEVILGEIFSSFCIGK